MERDAMVTVEHRCIHQRIIMSCLLVPICREIPVQVIQKGGEKEKR